MMASNEEIVELIRGIEKDTKRMWLELLSIREASFSFDPFEVEMFFKTDWGLALSSEMKPFNLIKDALEKARQDERQKILGLIEKKEQKLLDNEEWYNKEIVFLHELKKELKNDE